MHRLIVTSAAYRQSSHASRRASGARPEERASGSRAEVPGPGRDGPRHRPGRQRTARAEASAGPSVYPPQPEGVTSLAYGMTAWTTSKGADRYRRGLYTFLKRTSPYAAFITMDAPTSETVCVRRERSNTPLQALTLLNDTVFVEAAQALARRILAERPEAMHRRPDPPRLPALPRARPAPRRAGPAHGLPRPSTRPVPCRRAGRRQRLPAGCQDSRHPRRARASLNLDELAAWTTVARVILNLDETVTKE